MLYRCFLDFWNGNVFIFKVAHETETIKANAAMESENNLKLGGETKG